MRRLSLVVILAVVLLGGLTLWLGPVSQPPPGEPLEVSELLGEPADPGFQRASRPGGIRFPRDFGARSNYRNGWWYYTGNLQTDDGRPFGFQLTFFRFSLFPASVALDSEWNSGQIYMAHFAITDPRGSGHRAVERLSRPAAGLAGSRSTPYRIWLEDWEAVAAGEGFFPQRLRARDSGAGMHLDLQLEGGRGPWLQGDGGLSVKGPEPGNASHYFSFTRIPTRGRIELDGQVYQVTGLAWFDREWSTSSLGTGVKGWDWFALHLDDGRDLMFYSLRRQDGSSTSYSSGSLMSHQGRWTFLGPGDVSLQPLDWWDSQETGIRYPVVWSLAVPRHGLDLRVSAVTDAQEQRLSVVYWEGGVEVLNETTGQRAGQGYLEMTGY